MEYLEFVVCCLSRFVICKSKDKEGYDPCVNWFGCVFLSPCLLFLRVFVCVSLLGLMRCLLKRKQTEVMFFN